MEQSGVIMNNLSTALTIRAKILGVLIKNARLSAGKTLEECAQVMHIPNTKLEECELGEQSLSLPELEVLAHYLEVPLDHFWGRALLPSKQLPVPDFDIERLIKIRTRIIGTLIRMRREEVGLTVEEFSGQVGILPEQVSAYELGEMAIPLPLLETITRILGQPIQKFQDKDGPLGEWANHRLNINNFKDMPPEIQAFISRPINRPYIELAERMSQMSVQKLRSIAEGILEITL